MPTYKYKLNNGNEKWYCSFYIEQADGKRKKIKKSGFSRKKEAQDWEREYLSKYSGSLNMSFKSLYEIYIEDAANRLKLSTLESKKNIFNTHILPYFEKQSIVEINPKMIRDWQNQMLKKDISDTYKHQCNVQLSSILNYAVKFVGFPGNPVAITGKIGSKRKKEELQIWTADQFDYFINNATLTLEYRTIFNILFWSGMRIGELLALTWKDIENNIIVISKTYRRIKKQDIITDPKTPKSKRKVIIPNWLAEDISELKKQHYMPDKDDRVFKKIHESVSSILHSRCDELNIDKIHLHVLRHSHVAMLINENVNPLLISRRLGHENVQTTLNIYGHLYPNSDECVISVLDKVKGI